MVTVPTGDAAGAATGIGAIVVVLALIVVVAVLAARSSRRQREEDLSTPPGGGQPSGKEVEPNVAGLGLAFAAAILAIVSVFLPALESSGFEKILENTLIQSGHGWIIIGCAIGIIGGIYRVYNSRRDSWSVFILGAIILGVAIYSATGDRTKLKGTSLLGETIEATASPAVGIYAAGAAGVIAMFAGLVLAGHGAPSYRGGARQTKTCPDCAETVLQAARVCKHCGHKFEAEPVVEGR